ncbi:hypothetical protein PVA45_06120 [Entomospira entomophila]|uniref:Helicase XPB/Ssl2 N-terminal domain-containing protein n=1 Tax=Entomospira entomophila TaxID=2719988 RepID=A0A968G9I2_9SPIO|nr:hypothetical protein [Entomospira entomophilus]NIZ41073.1 hypothetical protein [Entomospira entomophilus]WDI35282.1 hypothetical protein PVA45_06120 [Entomospira entomophilus]
MPNTSVIDQQLAIELEQYFYQLNDASLVRLAKHYLSPDELYRKEKRDLIPKLIAFLQQESTQQQLIQLLDTDDIELLHAVYIYQQYQQDQRPSKQKELQSLLSLLYPWKEQKLLVKLQNLHDRLWVMKHAENHSLQINPILQPKLLQSFHQSHHIDGAILEQKPLLIPLSLIQAFLTVIFSKSKQEKPLDLLFIYFDTHLSHGTIQTLLKALHRLDIIDHIDQINLLQLKQLCTLSPIRINAIIYSMMICIEENNLEFDPLTDLITYLLTSAPKLWHTNDLIRLYYFWSDERKNIPIDTLLSLLQYYHILQKQSIDTNYYSSTQYTYQLSTLHIEANMSFFYPYDHPLEFIPMISSRLIRYDTFSQYILEKTHFIKAVEAGCNPDHLKHFYLDISDNRDLLEQTFNYWISATASFVLYQGYVLHIQAPYTHLLSNHEFIDKFVLHIIDKECVLLKKAPDNTFYTFFENSALPRPLSFQEHDQDEKLSHSLALKESPTIHSLQMFPHYTQKHTKTLSTPTKDPYQEILVERKLILHPDQLKNITSFRQQASGLDFQAKTRLIELAIKEQKDLYIQVKQSTGEKELHILPLNFDKKTTLLLKAYDYRLEKFVSIHASAMLHIEIIERSLIY